MELRTSQSPTCVEVPHYRWGEYDGASFDEQLQMVYKEVVYWRGNLFLLPKDSIYLLKGIVLFLLWLSLTLAEKRKDIFRSRLNSLPTSYETNSIHNEGVKQI